MGVPAKSYWKHGPAYPKGKTFGEILDWHLVFLGTGFGENDPAKQGVPWKLVQFAREVHNGLAYKDEQIAQKLRYWREGLYLPETEELLNRILRTLFGDGDGDSDSLADWRADLKRAWQEERDVKLNPAVPATVLTGAAANYVEAEKAPGSPAFRQHKIAPAARDDIELLLDNMGRDFFGRKSDLEAIDRFVGQRMDGGDQGLMVITAPAGFGKTTLAAHWCNRGETVSEYMVVQHFCSMSSGYTTTELDYIYENLCYQIADLYGYELSASGHFAQIRHLLSQPPPNGAKLIVWLDGIDEASDVVPCFLPKVLGERICVIISARAGRAGRTGRYEDDIPQNIPRYLAPWLTGPMAVSHNPLWHFLLKLTEQDIEELVVGLFSKIGVEPDQHLIWRIFYSSERGYPLFVRYMADDAIEAASKGEELDYGQSGSLLKYCEKQLSKLEAWEEWIKYRPLFEFLTIAQDAVSVEDLPALIGMEIVPNSLPRQILRWLTFVDFSHRSQPSLISFAHPKLAEVFSEALGSRRIEVINRLCGKVGSLSSCDEWPAYALRFLPEHLATISQGQVAMSLLMKEEFISARFDKLNAEMCPVYMQDNWERFYRTALDKLEDNGAVEAEEYINSDHMQFIVRFGRFNKRPRTLPLLDRQMHHLRFWHTNASKIKDLAAQGFVDVWRQLMCDAGLVRSPVVTEAHRTQSLLAVKPSGKIGGSKLLVYGAMALNERAGFLTWGVDGTLRLWGGRAMKKRLFMAMRAPYWELYNLA